MGVKGKGEVGMRVTVIPMSSREAPPVLKEMLGTGCTQVLDGGPSVSEMTCQVE